MSLTSTYTDSFRDTATTVSTVTGINAPKTGEYYQEIYSGRDVDTGVPVVGVDLRTTRDTGPIRLNDLRDAESLNIILNNTNTKQDSKTTNQQNPTLLTISQSAPQTPQTSVISGGGGLPLFGIIILMLLFGVMWLVYTIIRIWQNNQAQRALILASATNSRPIVEPPMAPIPMATTTTPNASQEDALNITALEQDLISDIIEDRRNAIKALDTQLNKLLTAKDIKGETISDKLKTVSAGQFKSIDIAWEAHQTAKTLLMLHDDELKAQDLSRLLKLFKQVFADHGVI